MELKNSRTFRCDACSKEISKGELRYMVLKTCCSVQRIPLCFDCYDKYGKKKK